MWVRSQDKKELVKCLAFAVAKNFGGKKNAAIIGYVSNGFWGRKEVILGLYDTKEIALDELSKLQVEIAGDAKVYEMN
ncbi:MAG TPA: hypothetical protein VJ951_07445 [Bacteroidales bacterium]|nr:hypothetical protein [Bacteroidales bacterium]